MNTKEDYEEKVNSLLSDECTYEKLPTRPNPVNQIPSRINQYGWNMYRNEKINKKCYHYLRCSNAITPRFYDLPKIHKSSVPLRPVVSFVNSPTYNLSKFLSRVSSSLLKVLTVFATLKNLLNVLGTILLKEMNV